MTATETSLIPDVLTFEPASTLALPTAEVSIDATIEAWLLEVRSRRGCERTAEEYRRVLGRFRELCPDLLQATPKDLHTFAYAAMPYTRTFAVSKKERDLLASLGVAEEAIPTTRTVSYPGKAPSASQTIVRLAALKGFYDFLRRMMIWRDTNPADLVKRPALPDPKPRGLEAGEMGRLLAAIPDTAQGKRDAAIILTSYLTGLRRAEVLSLTAGALSFKEKGVFFEVRTKGNHTPTRELPPSALRAIVASLEARGLDLDAMKPEERLFDVSSHGFYKNLRRYAEHAGLKDVSPHVLRHSFAKARRRQGESIETIAALLGHRNLQTTSRYLTLLDPEGDPGAEAVAAELAALMTKGDADQASEGA